MRHIVILHPFLKPFFLSRAGDAMLGVLNRLIPDHDITKQLNGTIDIAKQSLDAGSNVEEGTDLEGRASGAQESV